MPSIEPRDEDEAARTLADIYRLAQERIALQAALTTLSEWRHVAPGAFEQGPWLVRLARKILGLQNRSERLARRYYNAARAIQGGQALPNPYGNPYPSLVPLTRLLDDFGDVVDEVGSSVRRENRAQRRSRQQGDTGRQDAIESRSERVSDTLERALDRLERDHRDTLDVSVEWDPRAEWKDARQEADQVERQFRDAMEKEIRELRNKLQQIERDDERSAAERRAEMAKAAREAAYKAANAATKLATDPGQEQLNRQMDRDDLVVRYQRITGNSPCAFCALLASRGPVYKTEKSASFKPHDNCACVAYPVFSDSPVLSPRDQFFMDNYGTAQKQADKTRKRAPNKSGTSNDGLNNWRRWLAEQYRLGRVPSHDIYTRKSA